MCLHQSIDDRPRYQSFVPPIDRKPCPRLIASNPENLIVPVQTFHLVTLFAKKLLQIPLLCERGSSASTPASAPLQHEMECLPVLHLFCNTQLLNNSLDIANKVLHDTNKIHCRRTTYPSQESSILSFFRLFLRHRIPEEFKGCNTKSLNPSAMQVNTMTPTSKNKSPLVSPMYKGLEGYHVMGLRKPNKLP